MNTTFILILVLLGLILTAWLGIKYIPKYEALESAKFSKENKSFSPTGKCPIFLAIIFGEITALNFFVPTRLGLNWVIFDFFENEFIKIYLLIMITASVIFETMTRSENLEEGFHRFLYAMSFALLGLALGLISSGIILSIIFLFVA